MKTVSFFITMILTSGLSFVRIAVLTVFLDKIQFTHYSKWLALGAFASMLFSFGIIENTNKNFPRLVVNGRLEEVRNELSRVIVILSRRLILLLIIGLGIGVLVWPNKISLIVITLLLGFANSVSSLLASLQRGIGDLRAYSITALVRSILLFSCVVLSAWLLRDFKSVLVVEALVLGFGLIIAFFIAIRSMRLLSPSIYEGGTSLALASKKDGLFLYLGYLVVAIPFYLDRTFVTAIYDENEAAQYALFALFMTVGSLIVNAITQKVGPELVKDFSADTSNKHILRKGLMWSLSYVLIWALVVSILTLIFHSRYLPDFLREYKLPKELLLLLFVYGSLNISSLAEFLCISLSLEGYFFKSSIVFLALLVSAGVLSHYLAFNLPLLISLVFAVKLIYVIILSRKIMMVGLYG